MAPEQQASVLTKPGGVIDRTGLLKKWNSSLTGIFSRGQCLNQYMLKKKTAQTLERDRIVVKKKSQLLFYLLYLLIYFTVSNRRFNSHRNLSKHFKHSFCIRLFFFFPPYCCGHFQPKSNAACVRLLPARGISARREINKHILTNRTEELNAARAEVSQCLLTPGSVAAAAATAGTSGTDLLHSP